MRYLPLLLAPLLIATPAAALTQLERAVIRGLDEIGIEADISTLDRATITELYFTVTSTEDGIGVRHRVNTILDNARRKKDTSQG